MTKAITRAELLHEAKLLEELGAEWLPAHAAAFCNRSTSFLRRSSCPKVLKHGQGVKGKTSVVYLPADVRAWNAAQVKERVA